MADTKDAPWELITPDEILRRAEEHARKWAQASLATDLCDQEKIEMLLAKRATYLGNPARKPVWCTSIEDLIQKIAQESTNTLLSDQALLATYKKSVDHEVRSQLKTAVKKHSPTTPFNNFLNTLRANIQDSLSVKPDKKSKKKTKPAAQTDQTIEHLQEQLKKHLWTLYAREGNKFGPIKRLNEFWNEMFNFSDGSFYDCPCECLPNKRKVKNYFAYMGEMHEAGLWIYIPSKSAEYLLPIPSRFFLGSAQSSRESTPHIEWRNDEEKNKTSSGQAPLPSQDTDRVLKKLEAFLVKLEEFSLDEEVTKETKKIVEKISHLLVRLRKEYPSSNLPFEIRRIADSWLIERITSYTNLSPINRGKKRQTLLDSLTLLDQQIDKILEELELRRVSEFDIITAFLRDTFHKNSLEA